MPSQPSSSIRFQCVHCGGNVKVPRSQAGQTCRCPKCDAQIVAPGEEPADSSDAQRDDLDDFFADPAPPSSLAPADTKMPSPQPSTQSPSSSPAEQNDRPENSSAVKKPVPTVRRSARHAEFGQECSLCRTRMYATLEQVGKTIICPDCHTRNVVRPPRKKPDPNAAISVTTDADADADGFRLSDPVERVVAMPALPEPDDDSDDEPAAGSHPRPARPAQRPAGQRPAGHHDVAASTARDYLDRAERDDQTRQDDAPLLPDKPFHTGLIRFLFEPQAAVRWIVLTLLLFAALAILAQVLALAAAGGIQQIGAVFLTAIMMFVGLVFAFTASACGIAIIQETANGADIVEDWPGLNITEWMMESFFVVNTVFLSFVPGFLVGQVASCAGAPGWFAMTLGGVSMVALFPPFLLSMLEAGSATTPITRVIWDSLKQQTGTWRTFYLRVGILVVAAAVAAAITQTGFLPLDLIGCALLIGVMFVYYRLMGRLAWVLSESFPDQDEPETS